MTADKLVGRLSDFAGSGRVLQTSLTKETEDELRSVFEKAKSDVAQAAPPSA